MLIIIYVGHDKQFSSIHSPNTQSENQEILLVTVSIFPTQPQWRERESLSLATGAE